jgi:tetratricopeptide (TPR) repeat protein
MRFASRIAFTVAAALLAGQSPAARNQRPVPVTPADSLSALVEPLFAAGKFDSILIRLPSIIRHAEAIGDSILLGRAITQRGRVYHIMGDPRTVRDLEFGIRIAESVRDTVGLMPAVHFRGFAYFGQGDYDNAMRCFQRRLFLAQRSHAPADEAWARTSIAYSLHIRGDHRGAKAEYQRAIALFRSAGRPELELTALVGLGRVESALGDQNEAIRCYQRAWVVSRETGDRLNEMWATNNLSALEGTRGDLSRAAEYLKRAYAIAKELKSPQGLVIPASNLASRASELGDFAGADALLGETEKFCREHDVEELGVVRYHIAELRLVEGRYREAAAILRELTAGTSLEPQSRDGAILGLARALVACDSVEQARALVEERLLRKEAIYGDVRPFFYLFTARLCARSNQPERALEFATRARRAAEGLGQSHTAASARLRESVYCRELGRHAEAVGCLKTALDSLEAFRGGISTAEWREAYGQEIARGVIEAARVLLVFPDSLPRARREEAFFDTMQRFKTRTLLERISEPRFGSAAARERWSGRPATMADLQAVLQPGELVLDFVVGDATSYLFAVTLDTFRSVELPGPASPLAQRIELFRGLVANPEPAARAQYPPERLAVIQRALGREVLGGVADMVLASRRVFVSPDGFISMIPFGLLVLDDSGDVLMADRDVVQVPSASILVRQRTAQTPECTGASKVLAVAAAGSRLEGARDEIDDLARGYRHVYRTSTLASADGSTGDSGRCDVLHIAAHALIVDHSPWDSGIRLGADPAGATASSGPPGTSSLRADTTEILSTADSLLVARTFPGDPFLRAWQIARLVLRAKLAVLSACETAGGRVTGGEGTLGLTAAFMSAGVPVVVSSLWPVDDRATQRIMHVFYQRLAAGEPVATALRLAQLEVSRSAATSHPFLWAGFTVVGDGSATIGIDRKPRGAILWLALTLALLALALAAARHRRTRPAVG